MRGIRTRKVEDLYLKKWNNYLLSFWHNGVYRVALMDESLHFLKKLLNIFIQYNILLYFNIFFFK